MNICIEITVLSLCAAPFTDIVTFVLVHLNMPRDISGAVYFHHIQLHYRRRSPVEQLKVLVNLIQLTKSYYASHLCFQQSLQTGIVVVTGSFCLLFPSDRDTAMISLAGMPYLSAPVI
jgi:hypothetical protein